MLPDWQTDDGSVQLYCGDCLDILPTLEAESVDAVITDPPYGHNNNNGDLIHRWEAALGRQPSVTDSSQARPIANDGPEANDIVRASFPLWLNLLKPGCCCCCCGGGGPDPQFARWSLWMDEVFLFKQMVVWDKGPMGMGWHYRRSYETILVGQKPGGACHWCCDANNIENIIRPNQFGIRKIIPTKDDHPTPKPVALADHFIQLHSNVGDLVVDPFMGAGWVGVAAAAQCRRFIGIEIERKYFDMAVKRIKEELNRFPLLEQNPKTRQNKQMAMESLFQECEHAKTD